MSLLLCKRTLNSALFCCVIRIDTRIQLIHSPSRSTDSWNRASSNKSNSDISESIFFCVLVYETTLRGVAKEPPLVPLLRCHSKKRGTINYQQKNYSCLSFLVTKSVRTLIQYTASLQYLCLYSAYIFCYVTLSCWPSNLAK